MSEKHNHAPVTQMRGVDLDILVDRLRVKTPNSHAWQPLMEEAADAIEAMRRTSEAKP